MNLTWNQIRNNPMSIYRELNTSLFHGRSRYAPPPLLAKIETTRRCNLNCVVCFRHAMPVRPDMEYSDFFKILDKLPKVDQVALHGYGEPLIHKDFMKFFNALKNHGKQLTLVTNGTLLDNYTTERLMRFDGVQMVSFSIDSFHAHHYRGDYYADLAEIVKRTVKTRRLYGNHAKIIIHSTFNTDTIHTMAKMIEFAAETDVDTISLQDITYSYEAGDSTKDKAIRTQENPDHPLSDSVVVANLLAAEKVIELGVDAQFHFKDENRCHWLWHSIYVDVEGNVFPCTDTLSYPFGNILTDDFGDIWNGQPARRFRKLWMSDSVDECRKCISIRR